MASDKFPFPKAISKRLYNCHEGVGLIYYNAGDDHLIGTEFCVGRNSHLSYVQSGLPLSIELTDKNGIVKRFKVRLEEITQ